MMELVYPVEGLAPLLDAQQLLPGQEIFPVVTEGGVVVARATRKYCHSGTKVLHPVVHLHLIDRQERIYLQKRSKTKDIQPGKWDTAVGGHVDYGESIEEALHRESYEELALSDYNPIYLGSYTYDTGRDMELVNIFAAVGHFEVSPDLDEVDEGKWLTFSEIEKMAKGRKLTPNFQSEFEKIKTQLLALL